MSSLRSHLRERRAISTSTVRKKNDLNRDSCQSLSDSGTLTPGNVEFPVNLRCFSVVTAPFVFRKSSLNLGRK